MDSLRQLQYDAYSGNHGTSEDEVLLATCWPLAAVFLWNSLRQCGASKYLLSFPAQFFIFVFPLIPSFLFPTINLPLLLITTSVSFILLLLPRKQSSVNKNSKKDANLPHLTNGRASIMAMCTLGILAVDFMAFPRRFAKTASFGVSLMDVGVGTVVFSLGLTAARTEWTWKACRRTLFMLLLGILRMVLLRGVNYHVAVSEYGVHWNFFVTLGLLPLLVTISSKLCRNVSFTLQAVVLLCCYQLLLGFSPLQQYLLNEERSASFFSQNKEGIVSLVGYWSLFLLSIDVGRDVFQQRRSTLLIKFLVFTTAYSVAKYFNILSSRRFANFSFVMATLSFSLFHTLIFYFLERKLGDGNSVPPIYAAISHNQLIFFLIGNILTGLVNLACQTLEQPTCIAIIVLTVYMGSLCAMNTLLHNGNIKIKLS